MRRWTGVPVIALVGLLLASCAGDFDEAAIRGGAKTEAAFDLRARLKSS